MRCGIRESEENGRDAASCPDLAERPASAAPMHFCRAFRFLKSLRHMVLYVAYSIVYNIEYCMDCNREKYSKHNTKRFISRLRKMN